MLLIFAIISLFLHASMIGYAFVMYKLFNHVKFWSPAWMYFIIANILIIARRILTVFVLDKCVELTLALGIEYILLVLISIFFLLFIRKFHHLYNVYFKDGKLKKE